MFDDAKTFLETRSDGAVILERSGALALELTPDGARDLAKRLNAVADNAAALLAERESMRLATLRDQRAGLDEEIAELEVRLIASGAITMGDCVEADIVKLAV